MNQQLNNQPNKPENKKSSGGIIAIIVVVIFFLFGLSIWSNRPSTTSTKPQQQTTTTTKPPVFSSPIETTPTTSSFDLSIKSISVKKVSESEYSYYFSFRNKESKDFAGVVTLSLLDKNGNVVTKPEVLKLSFGQLDSENDNDVIFFNRTVSPSTVAKFRYSVTMNNEVVESGEDVIGDLL